MDINKNNYEAFFLDYHEGNLTAEQVAALLLFVEQHPELKEEFENFENCGIEDFLSIKFENKAILKKEVTALNQQDYLIGYIENTLSDSEKKLVTDFLKKNPAAHTELELFRKTIAKADDTIIYENKNALKKIDSSVLNITEPVLSREEDVLIASVENILTKKEIELFNTLVAGNSGINEQLELYRKTKLKADHSVVFENKEGLKRKPQRIIPFYYYAAAVAASILVLAGLFFLNKSSNTTTGLATINIEPIQTKETTLVEAKKEIATIGISNGITNNVREIIAVKSKTLSNKITDNISLPNDSNGAVTAISMQEQPQLLPIQKAIVNEEKIRGNEYVPVVEQMNEGPDMLTKQEYPAKTEEFVSLSQLAAEKIKEKLLDENAVYEQKKNGHLKKINGWDVAQLITKGISRLSGRNIEVKPYYNDQGDVTSYALIAGELKISKGHQ